MRILNIRALALALLCLFTFTGSAQAAELKHPYSALITGLEKVNSAKHTTEGYSLIYEDGELVFGAGIESKGVATRMSSTTFDSSSSIVTTVGDDKSGVETKFDFIRKGDDIYIKFKLADKSIKNKWIHVDADEYESFGEDLELSEAFKVADLSDPGGEDLVMLKKAAKLVEKHNLLVNIDDPVTKKKKGKMLTTYELEYSHKAVVPYFTELATVLTEEEKKSSPVGLPGFSDALKSKFFVDSLVESSYVRVVIDEGTGLPVEYAEAIVIPEFKNNKTSLEFATYLKLDQVNKKVTIKAPSKSISSDDALELLGLTD